MEEKLALAGSYIRTIRNSRTPICSLPADILSDIFVFTQTPAAQFMPTSPRLRFDSTQAAENTWHPSLAAGVCRYWRAVTLSFPSIWTTVEIGDIARAPNANIELAMLSLRRSYSSTVDVRVWNELPDSAISWFTETLASQSVRFKGFHLYDFEHGAKLLNALSECPAPQLENLTIQTWPQYDPPWQLPTLFAGITPQLRRLTLRYYSAWPGNNFSNLTHLCLERQASHPSSPRKTSDFLQFLASSPLLEELVINVAGPNDDGLLDSRTPEPRIELPRLRKVIIKASPIPCAARILSQIQISPEAHVQVLRCRDGSASTLLSSVAGCSNLTNITRLRIDSLIPSWTMHDGNDFPEIPKCIRLTGSGKASVDIFPGADMHEVASNQYMASLVGMLTSCKIEELWLGKDEVIIREALWQRIYSAMPMLRRLYIGPHLAGTNDNYPCLSALHVPDESFGLALPCPNLLELVMLGTTLDDMSLAQPAIRQLLQERKRRSFPISTVRVITVPDDSLFKISCTLLQEDVADLRQLVDNVTVCEVKASRYPNMKGLSEAQLPGEKLY
ncbi:hypothetical protein BC835DRAFT_1052539 [Cytidiella melzeri]|nr:hypothetical protein BC835DRAFT_1052539 [Cytidiella melzeri]